MWDSLATIHIRTRWCTEGGGFLPTLPLANDQMWMAHGMWGSLASDMWMASEQVWDALENFTLD